MAQAFDRQRYQDDKLHSRETKLGSVSSAWISERRAQVPARRLAAFSTVALLCTLYCFRCASCFAAVPILNIPTGKLPLHHRLRYATRSSPYREPKEPLSFKRIIAKISRAYRHNPIRPESIPSIQYFSKRPLRRPEDSLSHLVISRLNMSRRFEWINNSDATHRGSFFASDTRELCPRANTLRLRSKTLPSIYTEKNQRTACGASSTTYSGRQGHEYARQRPR